MAVQQISVCLSSALESDQLRGLTALIAALRKPREPNSGDADISLSSGTVADVLRAAREAPTDQIRERAIECIALMGDRPTLLAQMVPADAIPILVDLLRVHRQALSAIETVWSVHAVRCIAQAAWVDCDKLRAAGAMDSLLPLVRADISADLRNPLLAALLLLMKGQPAAQMAAAVTRIGTVLTDAEAPPDILCFCLTAFDIAIHSVYVSSDQPAFQSWADSILTAAAGVPQRLVDLLGAGQNPQVVDSALSLAITLSCSEADQLRQLFDCGLADRLPPLLNHADENKVRSTAHLCSNAAATEACALLLLDSAMIVEWLLALLSTTKGKTLAHVVEFFNNVLGLCDRHITRRLVHEFSMLPALVTVLRRATRSGDQTLTYQCLAIIGHVLTVGEAESKDDERRINPYVDRIDSFGAFELIKPLQDSEDDALADEATRVFSYIFPNDCD